MDKQKCLLIEHKHLSLQQSLIAWHFSPERNPAEKDQIVVNKCREKSWQIITLGRNVEKDWIFHILACIPVVNCL